MGALVGYFVFQNQRKGRVAAEAERVALAAGCTKIERKSDQGKQHGQPPFSYSQHPATSGTHAPAPLPPTPHVYPSPVEEGQAVHNLEHGYVWIYYRQAGNEALSDAVVSRLEGLADRETKVLMTPYPTLPEGQALALVAWNRLEQCPSGIAPDQAARVAQAFIGLFRSGGDAPESQAP